MASESSVQSSINDFLLSVESHSTLFVGFSGGMDSTVLLHALSNTSAVKNKNITIVAIYVDHGLQDSARHWALHCQNICEKLSIEFIGLSVTVQDIARRGVEQAARVERYQAFLKVMLERQAKNAYLVTGHHKRDQAETVLLNLFRGAGVKGLSAMPQCKYLLNSHKIKHCRPLLDVTYKKLLEYADYFDLDYLHDPSNDELNFKRNQVRNVVLPNLHNTWTDAENKLASTARHMQEASQLLDTLAIYSFQKMHHTCCYIELMTFDKIEWLEQKNAIRYWFSKFWPDIRLGVMHYEWIQQAFLGYAGSQNKNYSYQLSDGELRFYESRLYYLKQPLQSYSYPIYGIEDLSKFCGEAYLSVDGSKDLSFDIKTLGNEDKVYFRSIKGSDKVDKKLLKRFFQRCKIPVWERRVWPVLDVDGKVVSVLGCHESIRDEEIVGEINGANMVSMSFIRRMQIMQLCQ